MEKKKKSSEKNKIKGESIITSTTSTFLSIYLGTYEGKVIVVNINIKTKEVENNFSFSSSINAIRTIYHKSNSLFVSGTDEIIHMYNLQKKLSEGDLVTYSGSINDIKIYKNYLIVGGDEKNIPIWRMDDFNNILELKGHKKGIISFDIHSSGGFLVSCSKDKDIIVFDLLNGRKLKKFEFDYICNKLEFFSKDKYLLVVCDLHIYILDLMKSTENKNNDKENINNNKNCENIIQKIDFTKKIINSYVVKSKLIVIFTDAEIKLFDFVDYNIEEKEEIKNKSKKDKKKEENSKNEENNKKGNKEDKQEIINLNEVKTIYLEKPEKLKENDLDIKIRYVSICKIDKIKILTISYSNNEVYFYDLNKIIKLEGTEENKIVKKYGKIEFKIPGKITALDTELSEKKNIK